MARPIVLCGLGRMGWRVLDCLHTAGLPVVVVDTLCKPDDPRLRGPVMTPQSFRCHVARQ